MLELAPGVGGGRNRAALDDRVPRHPDDEHGGKRDHRGRADPAGAPSRAARAGRPPPRLCPPRTVPHRPAGSPERRVVVVPRRAERLPVAVDLEHGARDGKQRQTDHAKRANRAAAPGHHQQGDEAGEAEGRTASRGSARGAAPPRIPAPPSRRPLSGAGPHGARRGSRRAAARTSTGRRSRWRIRRARRTCPLRRTGSPGPRPPRESARRWRLPRWPSRSRRAGPARSGRAAAERAQREHDRVQQRAVPGVPGELLLAGPEHRQRAEPPYAVRSSTAATASRPGRGRGSAAKQTSSTTASSRWPASR